eukprot:467786-Hanusia_phi.AAC.1
MGRRVMKAERAITKFSVHLLVLFQAFMKKSIPISMTRLQLSNQVSRSICCSTLPLLLLTALQANMYNSYGKKTTHSLSISTICLNQKQFLKIIMSSTSRICPALPQLLCARY